MGDMGKTFSTCAACALGAYLAYSGHPEAGAFVSCWAVVIIWLAAA